MISKNKILQASQRISQCHFDGPSAGPAEANGFPEAHGPPHGPWGHCTPLPPLLVALNIHASNMVEI